MRGRQYRYAHPAPRIVVMMLGTLGFLLGAGCPIEIPEDLLPYISEPGPGSGSESSGAILVQTVEEAADGEYDIYDQTMGESVATYNSPNEPVSVQPGTYYLTEYFNSDFVYASDVVVTAGNTTTVTLGGIQLVTLPDASDGTYGIYNAGGETAYSTYNEPNTIVTAPAGTFTLKEYFNEDFTYATEVTVIAGETTTVEMGGIELVTVPGAADGTYGIYDESGAVVYASYNDPDVIITAPEGTFTLKEYFNSDFTYAFDVAVTAGAATTVEMGAIRYNGSLDYDIYVSGQLVSSYNEHGLIITAPAGTYTLTEYFDDENVLATDVVVVAGAVTDVP